MKIFTRIVICTAFVLCLPATSMAALLGPTSYLCFDTSAVSGCGTADSPFAGETFSYFHLEDFEDHLFNTPGVSASAGGVTSVVFGPSIHDSVDADDGVIDGSGLDGDSYFSASGSAGITFTFDDAVLGTLPTHVGIVWTDGGGTTTFEAFDSNGDSLGIIGPVTVATSGNEGQTDEDSFFGVTNIDGISSIFISNSSGGIEVDHLQYGLAAIPVPGAVWLFGSGLISMIGLARRKLNI